MAGERRLRRGSKEMTARRFRDATAIIWKRRFQISRKQARQIRQNPARPKPRLERAGFAAKSLPLLPKQPRRALHRRLQAAYEGGGGCAVYYLVIGGQA